MQVHIDGAEALIGALDKFQRRTVAEAASTGLKKAGMAIVADAQDNLRKNRINTTGRLSNSGRVVENSDGTIDAGFMSGEDNYAAAVEYGRRAGKFPPIDAIYQWLRKKTSGTTAEATRSHAFLIARKIARQGSTPHPYFIPAVKKNEQAVVKAVSDAVKKVIDSYV